jgi:predicted MPP superfamily phosphohydrolase
MEEKEEKKEDKKLRILAAGDLHGDQKLAERLAKRAEKEKVDLVVICGDITQFDQSTENMMKPARLLDKGRGCGIVRLRRSKYRRRTAFRGRDIQGDKERV